jgi:hypothetical protein
MRFSNIYFIILILVAIISCVHPKKPSIKPLPIGIEFLNETLRRSGVKGDNWCITWGGDGNQYTSMCDGMGWDTLHGFHRTRVFRIEGDQDNFKPMYLDGYPLAIDRTSWFGYGIISVDGRLYNFLSQVPLDYWSGPFLGTKLIYSPDYGERWFRYDGIEVTGKPLSKGPETMFFWKEDGWKRVDTVGYAFSQVSFVQLGQDHTGSTDDFVYMYSPDGAFSHQLNMARVHKDSIRERSAYWFFQKYNIDSTDVVWSKDIKTRGVVYQYPEKTGNDWMGWYSWLPSVVWNEGLGLFIMVNGGTYTGQELKEEEYADNWMHTKTGSLGFYFSEKPWGPWIEFYYNPYWTVDSPENRTYQPKFSPKWISEDGTEMVLIWSDAMKNEEGRSHSVNYKWNHMSIRLLISETN